MNYAKLTHPEPWIFLDTGAYVHQCVPETKILMDEICPRAQMFVEDMAVGHTDLARASYRTFVRWCTRFLEMDIESA